MQASWHALQETLHTCVANMSGEVDVKSYCTDHPKSLYHRLCTRKAVTMVSRCCVCLFVLVLVGYAAAAPTARDAQQHINSVLQKPKVLYPCLTVL